MLRSALCAGLLRKAPYVPAEADRAGCGWHPVSESISAPIGCFFHGFAGRCGPSMAFVWRCSMAHSREVTRMRVLTSTCWSRSLMIVLRLVPDWSSAYNA